MVLQNIVCGLFINLNFKEHCRAVDPHSFYADPDPAVFLNADPDPGPALPNLKKKIMNSFLKL